MALRIRYFGAIGEVTGVAEESVEMDSFTSLEQLKERTLAKYEGIKDLTFQLAVNQSLTESAELKDGDEVAFLPPFAGG